MDHQRLAARARCPNVGSKAATLPLQVAGDSKVIQSSLADRHHLVAPGERRQRIDRRLGRVLIVRMNADAGVDVRMIGAEPKRRYRRLGSERQCPAYGCPERPRASPTPLYPEQQFAADRPSAKAA